MNSIFIESNRKIASQQVKSSNAENQTYTNAHIEGRASNASWQTSLDSGIQLDEGDQITLKAAALNINGAGGEFQEFVGLVDGPDADGVFRKDNEVTIGITHLRNAGVTSSL